MSPLDIIIAIAAAYFLIGFVIAIVSTILSFTKYEDYYGREEDWYEHLLYILICTVCWIVWALAYWDYRIETKLRKQDEEKR